MIEPDLQCNKCGGDITSFKELSGVTDFYCGFRCVDCNSEDWKRKDDR